MFCEHHTRMKLQLQACHFSSYLADQMSFGARFFAESNNKGFSNIGHENAGQTGKITFVLSNFAKYEANDFLVATTSNPVVF